MGTRRIRETVPECPECGEAMRERTNRSTGEIFWGCRDYPDCKGTRPFDGPDDDSPADALPSERLRDRDRRRWETS